MGIKREREKIYNYRNIYNSLSFFHGKDVFKLSGKLQNWDDIEVITRIFYKKLEELLYSKEKLDHIYEISLKRILSKNGLTDKTLFEVIKDKKYHLEAINILLMRIFDYIYYNVKKNLPYLKILSQVSSSMSELFENTYKYTSGDFHITAGLKSGSHPLIIKIENNYNNLDDKVKNDLLNLQKGIDEINKYTDPNEAFMNAVRMRIEEENEDSKQSRLGFAKIRIDTNAKMKLTMNSNTFGEKGITITLAIPIEIIDKEILVKKIDKLFS